MRLNADNVISKKNVNDGNHQKMAQLSCELYYDDVLFVHDKNPVSSSTFDKFQLNLIRYPFSSSIMSSSETMEKEFPRTLVLFDIDGTLTQSRMSITMEMEQFLEKLKQKVVVGLVGGSDINKIAEQMTSIDCGDSFTPGNSAEQISKLIKKYDYIFAENGLIAYHRGESIGKQNILDELGEERLQRFINYALGYLSQLTIPVKRGNFIEFRNGLINVSPIGRSCSRQERNDFYQYDQQQQIRSKMIDAFRKQFDGSDIDMDYVIGGQISIDCFPKGWDKRYCLRYIPEDCYDKIYFFGDRCQPNGNDYALWSHERTIGYSVQGPDDTRQLIEKLFFSEKN